MTFDRRYWLRSAGMGVLAVLTEAASTRSARAGGGPDDLAFQELYKAQGVLGLELSPKTRALNGRSVRILGYVAPPLKAEAGFFVLTRAPVALCPFCNSDTDWPTDIVVVYPRNRAGWAQDGLPVAVSGTLDLGSKTDLNLGFVSLVRVVEADVRTLR